MTAEVVKISLQAHPWHTTVFPGVCPGLPGSIFSGVLTPSHQCQEVRIALGLWKSPSMVPPASEVDRTVPKLSLHPGVLIWGQTQ